MSRALFGMLLGVLVAFLLFGFAGGLSGAIVGGGREDGSLLANTGIGPFSWVSGVLSFVTGPLRHAVLMTAHRAEKKPGGLIMSTQKKPAKRIYTLAAAIGLTLGAMGIAGAATSGSTTPSAPATDQVQADSVAADPAPDVAQADPDTVQDQSGAEVTDPNEPAGVEDPTEGPEADAVGDEAIDGIDFQQEGENVGNNGGPAEGPDDVIGGADDAAEAATG